MDTLFLFSEDERSNLFQWLVQSFASTYICLWSFLPPSNCLLHWDGYYQEDGNQLAHTLFNEYRQQIFRINEQFVPGVAFKNNNPYIELHELHLQRRASVDVQRRFYQEAGIKTAIFMGCNNGEIELGWSDVKQIIDIENKIKSVFPVDFSRALSPLRDSNQRSETSSSSSLRSLSNMDRSDSSSLLLNVASSSHDVQFQTLQDTNNESLQPFVPLTTFSLCTSSLQQETIQNLQLPIQTTTNRTNTNHLSTSSPYQLAMQSLDLSSNVMLPRQEIEDAIMTRAYLAVLSSSSSSSSSAFSGSTYGPRPDAFRSYNSPLGTTLPTRPMLHEVSMLSRGITYYTRLNIDRRGQMATVLPSSTHLRHVIAERRRREKINEIFQALRALLPPKTKKDKASVLIKTRDYLTTLKDQVVELSRKSQQLEAQVSSGKGMVKIVEDQCNNIVTTTQSSNARFNIQMRDVPESTSSQHVVDLQVIVRGESRPSLDVLVESLLEFLRRVRNVNLMSITASYHEQEASNPFNLLVLRLAIEENEWDKSAFEEAIRRIVSDMGR